MIKGREMSLTAKQREPSIEQTAQGMPLLGQTDRGARGQARVQN